MEWEGERVRDQPPKTLNRGRDQAWGWDRVTRPAGCGRGPCWTCQSPLISSRTRQAMPESAAGRGETCSGSPCPRSPGAGQGGVRGRTRPCLPLPGPPGRLLPACRGEDPGTRGVRRGHGHVRRGAGRLSHGAPSKGPQQAWVCPLPVLPRVRALRAGGGVRPLSAPGRRVCLTLAPSGVTTGAAWLFISPQSHSLPPNSPRPGGGRGAGGGLCLKSWGHLQRPRLSGKKQT